MGFTSQSCITANRTNRTLDFRLATALGALIGFSFLLSGCATILSGSSQSVTVTSEPAGAQVYLDGKKAGVTPVDVEVSKTENHVIEVRSDSGTASDSVNLQSSVAASWVVLDVLTGLVPAIVDAATGSWRHLSPSSVHVALARTKVGIGAVAKSAPCPGELRRCFDQCLPKDEKCNLQSYRPTAANLRFSEYETPETLGLKLTLIREQRQESPKEDRWRSLEREALLRMGGLRCHEDRGCKLLGLCTFDLAKDSCLAGADADCAGSRVCQESGKCMARSGACVK